jgi:hypothetical protein
MNAAVPIFLKKLNFNSIFIMSFQIFLIGLHNLIQQWKTKLKALLSHNYKDKLISIDSDEERI